MKLSDLERLSLANQFRIRAATEGDNRLLHYAEILEQGHESLYDLLFQSIAEPKPRMVGDDVKDILVMFLALEASYDEGAKPPRSAMFPKFLGFEKTDPHFEIAGILIQEAPEFKTFRNRPLLAPEPTLRSYMAMLDIWRKLGRPPIMNGGQVAAVVTGAFGAI